MEDSFLKSYTFVKDVYDELGSDEFGRLPSLPDGTMEPEHLEKFFFFELNNYSKNVDDASELLLLMRRAICNGCIVSIPKFGNPIVGWMGTEQRPQHHIGAIRFFIDLVYIEESARYAKTEDEEQDVTNGKFNFERLHFLKKFQKNKAKRTVPKGLGRRATKKVRRASYRFEDDDSDEENYTDMETSLFDQLHGSAPSSPVETLPSTVLATSTPNSPPAPAAAQPVPSPAAQSAPTQSTPVQSPPAQLALPSTDPTQVAPTPPAPTRTRRTRLSHT